MSVKDPVYEAFLVKLRAARERAGMTQKEAADAFGRPQSFIAKIETGQRRIDVSEAMRLAAIIGTTLAALLPEVGTEELVTDFKEL